MYIDIRYYGTLAFSALIFMTAGYQLFDHQWVHTFILSVMGFQIGWRTFTSPIKPIKYE